MKIDRIELHHISQPLVHPFRTSFGEETERPCVLVAISAGGVTGWGECPAGDAPFYSYETIQTAWHILHDYLAPMLLGSEIAEPAAVAHLTRPVRGHPMAHAALENAVWDLFARRRGVPLSALLGGVRDRVPVGVSIGIQSTMEGLLARVDDFVRRGYRRIKLKIEPGWEVEPVRRVREKYPDLLIMADANSAFSLDDAPLLQKLDQFDLLMIEQPLGYDDIAAHALLQRQLKTPLCLDESIHSVADARAAVALEACGVINMKVARVGGLSAAVVIHDLAREAGLQMWCGGMLETGVGRATNVHLATLPNFTLPGDISATDRYYAEDIADPPFLLNEDSTVTVPTDPGIGVTVRRERLARWRLRQALFTDKSYLAIQ